MGCVLSDDAQIVSLTHLCVSWQEEQSLLQLEEAIEALDANLELKNRSIQDRQEALLTSDTSLSQLQNMEPVKLANIARKLEGLPPSEVLRLLARYFNRVRAKRTHIKAQPNIASFNPELLQRQMNVVNMCCVTTVIWHRIVSSCALVINLKT